MKEEIMKMELIPFRSTKNRFYVKIKDKIVGTIGIDDFEPRTVKVIREVFL